MKIVTGYSVWMKPQGNIKRKLANLMLRLSKEYSTPLFYTPHITLYENIHGEKDDLILKTSKLARRLKPFKIKLTEIDNGKNFNNLVILVQKNKELMRAYQQAKKIFKIKPKKKKYIPHLTLLLKDISQTQREKIINKIGKNFNLEFEIKSIYLVPIGNNPKNWIPIKRFKLKK